MTPGLPGKKGAIWSPYLHGNHCNQNGTIFTPWRKVYFNLVTLLAHGSPLGAYGARFIYLKRECQSGHSQLILVHSHSRPRWSPWPWGWGSPSGCRGYWRGRRGCRSSWATGPRRFAKGGKANPMNTFIALRANKLLLLTSTLNASFAVGENGVQFLQ